MNRQPLKKVLEQYSRWRPGVLDLARRHLLGFTVWTKPDYQPSWHHRLLADRLTALWRGQVDRLVVSMPPGHGKSELCCRRFPAWVLGWQPSTRVLLATHTASLAQGHSRSIQRIMASREYQELFPLTERPARRLKQTDDLFELPQGGYLRAVGVGGAITGYRVDLGIIDDPVPGRMEADSPTWREHLWQWFTSDFLTRLDPEARVVVVMTRWHRDDLVGRLLRLGASRWEYIRLPALAEAEGKHPADPRQPGEALWPERFDQKTIEEISRQDPRAFAGLWQQDPAEAQGAEWPASYFGDWLWYDPERWPPPVDWWILAIDPSRGRTDKAGDYTAMVAVGLAPDRGLLFVDALLDRLQPEETIRKALAWYDLYRPRWIVVESNQFHGLLERQLERDSISRFGFRVPVWPVQNTEMKLMRIRRLGPYLANRELRFRPSPGCRLLVEQLQDWPVGQYDDGPDALEMAIRIIQASAPMRPEPVQLEEWRYRWGV